MIETSTAVHHVVDASGFATGAPRSAEALAAESLSPIDPDGLPWAKTLARLSDRLRGQTADLASMSDLHTPQGTLSADRIVDWQREVMGRTLAVQTSMMSTAISAQAAVQLMSTTSQVANKMLNQQGG